MVRVRSRCGVPGLRAAYRTAIDLRRVGLDFVVAPVASRSGEPAERIDEQHGLSVLPFVDGEAGLWGRPVAQQGREALATMLARLHDSTAATLSAPRRELVVPGRDEFAAQHHQRR